MSIYDNFGSNLRELCKSKGSVTGICRELDINRQQFNKYLNGDNFPRKATLEKICRYFAVSDVELLLPKHDAVVGNTPAGVKPIMLKPEFSEILCQVSAPQDMPLKDGKYLTYFYPSSKPDWIMRSVTFVKTEGAFTQFKRLTGYGIQRRSAWNLWRGHHRGLVLNRRNTLYFMALDRLGAQVPSLSIFQWSPVALDLLKGISIVLTPNGAEACTCIMDPLPQDTSIRAAIAQCGAFGIKENTVPVHIKQLLHNI